ncbi:MAG TPA: HEAT repeat domain-containing protein [Pirellulales bacterium]|nr:HEAT repeat domain-containing protein [Pirellulales bacterium]
MTIKPCAMIVAALVALAPLAARGETSISVFTLANGGQVVGELMNPQESPRTKYVIKTNLGGEVTLERDQVKEIVRRRPADLEYERIRPSYADTAAAQWELSEWCREQTLIAARQYHLKRVLELDPEHAEARRALGYSRVDGRWQNQQEIMTQRGYVEYKGRWRLKQEVEILEQQRKNELAEKGWFTTIKRWREWLDTDKRFEAQKNFVEIRDPAALPALKKYLETENIEAVRVLLVESLARTGVPGAYGILANRALEDPSNEVRLTCLDFLDDAPHPEVVQLYIQKLRDKDNTIINRAAIGLQRLKDPSAIGPLVDALVTTHTFKTSNGAPPGQYSASFGPNGGGFGMGSSAPTIVKQTMNNGAVLDALVALTGGVNYNFDVSMWRKWLASNRKGAPLDARRG